MDENEKQFLVWGIPIQFGLSLLSLPLLNLIERLIFAIIASILGWIIVYKIYIPLHNYVIKCVKAGIKRVGKILKSE